MQPDFPNPTEVAGASPPEWSDPTAASLGLGPEPTTFEIFASWVHRNLPGDISDALQSFVAWLTSIKHGGIVERWTINADSSITMRWGTDLSATIFADRVEWSEKGSPPKARRQGSAPDGVIGKIGEHKARLRSAAAERLPKSRKGNNG